MAEDYHAYTPEELDPKTWGDESEHIEGPGRFHVYASTAAYRSGCGGQSEGVWSFAHLLHALDWFYDEWRPMAEGEFREDEFQEWCEANQAQIRAIRERMSDEGASLGELDIQTSNVEFIIHFWGYWDEFAPAMLESLEYDVREDAEDEDEDDEEQKDGSPEGKGDLLARVQALKARSDIKSSDFVDELGAICSELEW